MILRTPRPHALDVWLPRLANFAQVALLAITAGSLYFTVLPLYQKALLDEAIARKEIELKEATASLEIKYGQLRQLAVRDFVMITSGSCSGLDEMLHSNPDRAPGKTNAFTIDVKKCILDHEAKARSLVELRPDDRTFLRTTVAAVADRIVKLQAEAAANYARAETDINDSNIDMYVNKTEFVARALPVLSHMMTPKDIAAFKRKQAVAELRSERLSAYYKQTQDELYGLLKITWPPRQH